MNGILALEGVTKRFGGLLANRRISFSANKGEIIGLIGPNGAGKSTLFNCIACFYEADEGRVLYKGTEITHKTPEETCALGIGRTFQIVRIFREMSVLENIMTGAFLRHPKRKGAEKKAEDVGALFGFTEKLHASASSLTISEQKRLEVARIYATGPEIMLLDEMMAGLNIQEVRETVELIRRLKAMGVTLIMVEHVMEAIMPVSDRVVVLNYGEKIAEGPPGEITRDPEVIKAYLGEKYYAKSGVAPDQL
jgi:branched-chain amino acid transport system ATP-binding protein